jgi:hypothetical protein
MASVAIESPQRPLEWRPALLAIVVFAALSVCASITSPAFLEADGCTHYLYARYALVEPHYLVNVWGRPLCTGIYALPALFAGRFGVRTASLFLAIGCALVAGAIARQLDDRRPALAVIFTLAEPLLFLHSFSELTELPFALLLGCAFLAYVRRQWGVMTVLISLGPLARPEGFGFLLLAAIALTANGRLRWLAALPVPLIVWDIAGWRLFGEPVYPGFSQYLPRLLQWIDWLPQNWPYAAKSVYTPGSIFHFAMLLPVVTSPLLFPATCLGLFRTVAGEGTRQWWPITHDRLCRLLTALVPLLILVVHSLLYFTGRMASSGEVRYMLVVAPFWGVLSARGWMWLFERYRWRWIMPLAAIASLAPVAVNRVYRVIPLSYSQDWVEAHDIADWLAHTPLRQKYPRVLAAHPGIFFFLDMSMTDPLRAREWTCKTIDAVPPGTILVWDSVYGVYNADTNRSVKLDEILRAGWQPLPSALAHDKFDDKLKRNVPEWRMFLSKEPRAGSNEQRTTNNEQ